MDETTAPLGASTGSHGARNDRCLSLTLQSALIGVALLGASASCMNGTDEDTSDDTVGEHTRASASTETSKPASAASPAPSACATPLEPPADEASDDLDDRATLDPDKAPPEESVTTETTLRLDQRASIMVDARSDVFSAGLPAPDPKRGGVLPAAITLAPAGGLVLFSRARGRIGCAFQSNYGPDGGSCAGGHTKLSAADSVSGIVASERTLFVSGVFMGTDASPVPSSLDFSPEGLGLDFERLAPALGQSFFIGDGLTGTDSGVAQEFTIPAGATMLFVGFADGFDFQGTPGYYDDNTGSVILSLTQQAR